MKHGLDASVEKEREGEGVLNPNLYILRRRSTMDSSWLSTAVCKDGES